MKKNYSCYTNQDYVESLFSGSMGFVRTTILKKNDDVNSHIYLYVRRHKIHLDNDLYLKCKNAYNKENDRMMRELEEKEQLMAAASFHFNIGKILDLSLHRQKHDMAVKEIVESMGDALAQPICEEIRRRNVTATQILDKFN
jgi:hypothetical protein